MHNCLVTLRNTCYLITIYLQTVFYSTQQLFTLSPYPPVSSAHWWLLKGLGCCPSVSGRNPSFFLQNLMLAQTKQQKAFCSTFTLRYNFCWPHHIPAGHKFITANSLSIPRCSRAALTAHTFTGVNKQRIHFLQEAISSWCSYKFCIPSGCSI